MITDYHQMYMESSVAGAAWLGRVMELMKMPPLVEWVEWCPDVTIVLEG